MAKGYWVATYRSISNPDAFAEYGKLAGPAIQAGGGRFLVRGNPSPNYENGPVERGVAEVATWLAALRIGRPAAVQADGRDHRDLVAGGGVQLHGVQTERAV